MAGLFYECRLFLKKKIEYCLLKIGQTWRLWCCLAQTLLKQHSRDTTWFAPFADVQKRGWGVSGMVWDTCARSPLDFEPGMFNLISLFRKGKDGFSVLEVERPWLLSVSLWLLHAPQPVCFCYRGWLESCQGRIPLLCSKCHIAGWGCNLWLGGRVCGEHMIGPEFSPLDPQNVPQITAIEHHRNLLTTQMIHMHPHAYTSLYLRMHDARLQLLI